MGVRRWRGVGSLLPSPSLLPLLIPIPSTHADLLCRLQLARPAADPPGPGPWLLGQLPPALCLCGTSQRPAQDQGLPVLPRPCEPSHQRQWQTVMGGRDKSGLSPFPGLIKFVRQKRACRCCFLGRELWDPQSGWERAEDQEACTQGWDQGTFPLNVC